MVKRIKLEQVIEVEDAGVKVDDLSEAFVGWVEGNGFTTSGEIFLVDENGDPVDEEEPEFDPSGLEHGVYTIFWKDGGSSVAAVGSMYDGTRWYAAANWAFQEVGGTCSTDWSLVSDVELIKLNKYA